jgi:protein TonB
MKRKPVKHPKHTDLDRLMVDGLLGERSPLTKPGETGEFKAVFPGHERRLQQWQELLDVLPTIIENERNPMIDLTLEQKAELYASFTDLFPRRKDMGIPSRQAGRLFLGSMGAALLLMATVPLVQWMSEPLRPKGIIESDGGISVLVAPEIPEVNPPPPVAEEKPEPEEVEPFRPDIEQLTYPSMPFDGVGAGMGGVQYEFPEVNVVDDIVNLVDVDVMPRPLSQVAPVFPAILKREGLSGQVTLEFVVDERGNVTQAKVLRSTHPDFSASALDALRKWRFEPGQKDGHAVKTRMRVPLIFNVKD